MMKIKFTHDFRGKITQERFYLEGTEIECEEKIAEELIDLNHAVAVEGEPFNTFEPLTAFDKMPETVTHSPYSDETHSTLYEMVRDRGINMVKRAKKEKLIAALVSDDELRRGVTDGS